MAAAALLFLGLLIWSVGPGRGEPLTPRELPTRDTPRPDPESLQSVTRSISDRVAIAPSQGALGEPSRPTSSELSLVVHGVVAFETGERVAFASVRGRFLGESVEALTAQDGTYRLEFEPEAGSMDGQLRLSSGENAAVAIYPHEEQIALSSQVLSLRIDLVASTNYVVLAGSVVELQPPHEELDCPVTVVANGSSPVVSMPGSGFEVSAPIFGGSCSFEFWTSGGECRRRGVCTVEVESPVVEAAPQMVSLYMPPSVTRDLLVIGAGKQPIGGARAVVPGGRREVGVSGSDGQMTLCWDDERGFLALESEGHGVVRLELGALRPGKRSTIRMKPVEPLRGWVRTTDGRPLPGALVSLSNSPSSAFGLLTVRADQDGEFVFRHRLADEINWLHVTGDPAVAVPVSPSQIDRVEVVVPASGTITGVISDETGRPIGGAIVSAVATGEGALLTAPYARASFDGTYVLKTIAEMEYEVAHDAIGFRSKALSARSGDELRVVLARSCRATLDLSDLLARGWQDFSLCAGLGAGRDFEPKTAWYYHSRVSTNLVVPLAFAEPLDEVTVRVLLPHSGETFDVPCVAQETAESSARRVLWSHRSEGD